MKQSRMVLKRAVTFGIFSSVLCEAVRVEELLEGRQRRDSKLLEEC